MSIDKQKLQKLLWAEAASYRADCTDWKRNTEALQEFLGEKTVEEVALELLVENERLKTLRSTTERDLAQELEVWKHGPSCWNCGDTGDVHDMVGEWRGQCDCNAAKLIDVSSERDQLRAENEALRSVMACVVSEIPNHNSRNGNASGHCHAIPGVWDQGNGAKSGTECAWCKVWNAATAMSNERPRTCGSEQGSISAETPVPERSACGSENP